MFIAEIRIRLEEAHSEQFIIAPTSHYVNIFAIYLYLLQKCFDFAPCLLVNRKRKAILINFLLLFYMELEHRVLISVQLSSNLCQVFTDCTYVRIYPNFSKNSLNFLLNGRLEVRRVRLYIILETLSVYIPDIIHISISTFRLLFTVFKIHEYSTICAF